MATGAVLEIRQGSRSNPSRARIYMLVASCGGAAALGLVMFAGYEAIAGDIQGLVIWTAAAFLADALVVQIAPSATLSMSMPVTLGAAIVLSPPAAALAAFIGTWSRADGHRRDPLIKAFNRVQVSCATLAASFVASSLDSDPVAWPAVLGVALAALLADTSTNVALMVPFIRLSERVSLIAAARLLLGDRPAHNMLVYLSAVLTGPVVALCYVSAGPIGLGAALVGIVLGGRALLESQRAAGLLTRIESKDAAIRTATDQAVRERRDERTSLAGELHDEVLPALFKVHLMGQVVRHDLASGRLLELEEDVASLLDATEAAQLSMREVVGGLRTTAMGPEGLPGAIRHVADQLRALDAPRIELDVQSFDASERGQLVAFQVIREALGNAAKYSRASRIRVSVRGDEGWLRVVIDDDGSGFDPAARHEGHFGLLLMRERVEAAGGSFNLDARLGLGVVVSASIPVQL